MTAASTPEVEGGIALEEAVVCASCRAAITASASRIVVEVCSSRRRVMAHTRV
jgi:hypothetical protein